jgi:hypothetical protein
MATISFWPYATADGGEPTPDEVAEINARLEARRAAIRADSMRLIGRSPDGSPLPPADAGEEERLATADLRAPLREAIAARRAISLRLADQQNAVERGQAYLETARSELRDLEGRMAAGERDAADRLADSFRGSEKLLASDERLSPPATSEIEAARTAVERAQAAVVTLTGEVVATRGELQARQRRVGLAVLDVVKAELLKIGREVAALDHLAAQLRSNLEQAGYVTGNLAVRHGWRATTIFTTTAREAIHYRPPDRPPAASVAWEQWINRLFADAEVPLE